MRSPSVSLNRSNAVLWIAGGVSLLLVGILVAGYDLWYQSHFYVASDYAMVAGSLTEVVAPAASRVSSLDTQLGGRVEAGQPVVTVESPGQAGPASTIAAPRGGTVVGLFVRDEQLVFAEQLIAAIAEPTDLWVVANVPVESLDLVQVGHPAEIQLVLSDHRVVGRVAEVLADWEQLTADSQHTGASLVPVRIALEGDVSGLHPGMAAYVKIRVR